MPSVVIDNFTDADATDLTAHRQDWGPGWQTLTGAWTVQGNAARCPSGADSMIATGANAAHLAVQCNTTIPGDDSSTTGLVLRMADASNGWSVTVQRDGGGTPYLIVNEIVAGTPIQQGDVERERSGSGNDHSRLCYWEHDNRLSADNTSTVVEYTSATSNNTASQFGLFGYGGFAGYATGDYDYFEVTVLQWPLVLTVATSGVDSNGATHAVTMPANIVAGDFLLVVSAFDGNPTISVETGASGLRWNKLGQASNGTACTGSVFWKIAEGSDALTLTIGAASEQSSSVAYRIFNGNFVSGTSANGSSADSNPPDFVPTNGSKDYLFIATRSGDAQVQATVAPTGYAPLRTRTAGAAGGGSVATCEKNVTAASDNPGTFTSNTEQWVSWTLAVEMVRPSREFNVSHAVTRAASF